MEIMPPFPGLRHRGSGAGMWGPGPSCSVPRSQGGEPAPADQMPRRTSAPGAVLPVEPSPCPSHLQAATLLLGSEGSMQGWPFRLRPPPL